LGNFLYRADDVFITHFSLVLTRNLSGSESNPLMQGNDRSISPLGGRCDPHFALIEQQSFLPPRRTIPFPKAALLTKKIVQYFRIINLSQTPSLSDLPDASPWQPINLWKFLKTFCYDSPGGVAGRIEGAGPNGLKAENDFDDKPSPGHVWLFPG
jgi:hypothetical protein